MSWTNLLFAVQHMSPVEAMLTTVVVLFFLYRSGVNWFIPFIKKSKNKRYVEEQPTSLLSIHKDCANFTSISVILKEVMNVSDKIFRIKYQDTLYKQMNEAEIMWDKCKVLLKTNFKNTYKNENGDSDKITQSACIHSYETIIDSIEVDMMGLIRRWMKNNHFVDKNDVDYSYYIKEKFGLLHNRMLDLFDERYNDGQLKVDRETLAKTMQNNVLHEIEALVTQFFLTAKTIAEASNAEIEKLEKKIENI